MRWTTWFWSRILFIADSLLGSHLVERELERRQQKIEKLMQDIGALDQDLRVLEKELTLSRTMLCLVELKARSERDERGWLRFSPHIDGDESLLDDVIECLVKTQLAYLDAWPTGSGEYSYRLFPDWAAIGARVLRGPVAPELVFWLAQLQGQGTSCEEEPSTFINDRV